jgi:hypothetical protein
MSDKVHYRTKPGIYVCGVGKQYSSQDISSVGISIGVTCGSCLNLMETGRIYPCDRCGKLRSKAEGGTTFTVCDECWDDQRGRFGEGATGISSVVRDFFTESGVEVEKGGGSDGRLSE